jgi:hypothetical protein
VIVAVLDFIFDHVRVFYGSGRSVKVDGLEAHQNVHDVKKHNLELPITTLSLVSQA